MPQPQANALKSLTDLYALWSQLRDIPVVFNEDDETVIDEPFLQFSVGTPCETIWHWFESQNPRFLVGEVQQGICHPDRFAA